MMMILNLHQNYNNTSHSLSHMQIEIIEVFKIDL
jgi:hypothetical protein